MKTNLLLLAMVFALLVPQAADARYIRPQLEATPVDRLVKNLSEAIKVKPKDVQLRFNLARVHAMAYALKTDQTQIRKGKEHLGAWFGYEPRPVPFRAVKTQDAPKQKEAEAQLKLALKEYATVLKMNPKHLAAQLGYGWCLMEAGQKAEAMAQLRKTIELGWAKEKGMRFAGLGFHSIVGEAAKYLRPMLDAQKDADELATLQHRIAVVSRIRRPVTPLVVPLRAGLGVADLIDRDARVRFDADGSGERKAWSWIRPDAAWLVYDRRGTGEITSALQLFGNVTFWTFWENGYQALTMLDDNRDRQLTGNELQHLALWRDANANGRSEPGEVIPLSAAGITALSCQYTEKNRTVDCRAESPAGVTFANGQTRPTFDLILHPAKK